MKTPSVMWAVIIIAIIAAGYAFVSSNTQDSSFDVSEIKYTSWKTYSNNQYSYAIQYPDDWYIDTTYSESKLERSFKGEEDTHESIGGQTIWSNYPNPGQYDLGNRPANIQEVYLHIRQDDRATTLEEFWKLQNYSFDYATKEDVAYNGISGYRLLPGDSTDIPDGARTQPMIFLKFGAMIFQFSTAVGSPQSVEVMEKMLATFTAVR